MMSKSFRSLILLALAIGGCQRPAPLTSGSEPSTSTLRLVRPEELVIPPEMSEWPRAVPNGHFPHYPPAPRSNGVEARIVAAFVIDQNGRPEYRTISILQSPVMHREFVRSVCEFLRNDAEFSWGTHAPARALVIMPFEFSLQGVPVTEMMPPAPNLAATSDSLRRMSPTALSAWVQSKPHCL